MTNESAAAAVATADPSALTLAFLEGAALPELPPTGLVDAVIASERLLAHVHAVQARLLAELGRPGRCGDITALVDALVDKAGAGRGPDGEIDAAEVQEVTVQTAVRVAAAEVAAVLDWSPVTGKIRIQQAQRLESALPGTLSALDRGRIDVGRARMVCDRTAVLDPDRCRAVERRILPMAKGRSKAALETMVDREVVLADPAAAENRRVKAHTDRSVSHRSDKDGMGIITALLPAEAAVLLFTLLDLIAQAHKGLDRRTVDQRRADALADVADELLTHGYVDLDQLITCLNQQQPQPSDSSPAPDVDGAADTDPDADTDPAAGTSEADIGTASDADAEAADPVADEPAAGGAAGRRSDVVLAGGSGGRAAQALSRHGRRPHLNVTGALSTLAGLDESPGHLDGHGVITAPLLRAIAASWGTLTTIGIDPATGTATAIGALTYRPRQHLADQVITLAGTCRTAGCRQPARRCDLDHLQPFHHQHPAAGGGTELANLVPACKFHHLLKHHSDWTPQLQPDLTIRWTTNTGHHATSHPRQFTLPGEWHHDPGQPLPADQSVPSQAPARADADATEPRCPQQLPPQVIHGPTVTGPTIPVLPTGSGHTEPHTELEDPDTIPDPGSVQIHPYRINRGYLREHTLRRHQLPVSRHPNLRDRNRRDPAADARRYAPAGAAWTQEWPDDTALKANVNANLAAIRTIRDHTIQDHTGPETGAELPGENLDWLTHSNDADLPTDPPF